MFGQLRIDPFYRTIARVHPDLAPAIEALIVSLEDPATCAFVHADFSPENILVHLPRTDSGRLRDRTCGRSCLRPGLRPEPPALEGVRAAPADDALLTLTQVFLEAYLDRVGSRLDAGLVRRACLHAAACSLARSTAPARSIISMPHSRRRSADLPADPPRTACHLGRGPSPAGTRNASRFLINEANEVGVRGVGTAHQAHAF